MLTKLVQRQNRIKINAWYFLKGWLLSSKVCPVRIDVKRRQITLTLYISSTFNNRTLMSLCHCSFWELPSLSFYFSFSMCSTHFTFWFWFNASICASESMDKSTRIRIDFVTEKRSVQEVAKYIVTILKQKDHISS